MPAPEPKLTLREKQSEFARCLGELLGYIFAHNTWAVTLAEGYVGDTDARDGDYDGPHLKGGAHYHRLGQDLNLFIRGSLIVDGSHKAWREIGEYWEQRHPLARWGGRFADSNHFSFEHEGKS